MSSQLSLAHSGFFTCVQSLDSEDDILSLIGGFSECESDYIIPGQPEAPALVSAGESEPLVVMRF